MSLLDQKRVLRLNAAWRPLDTTSVADAFTVLSKGTHKALHIEYPVLDNGNVDFDSPCTILPVEWKDWINLPIRAYDKFICTSKTKIRVPTIIIAKNYEKIPIKKPRYSKNAVWLRDGGICQITGEKLSKSNGNIDHWIPQAKNGKTDFENCLLLRRDINSRKGDMTMEEFCRKFGYKLPKKPERPTVGPRKIVNNFGIPDWDIWIDDD